MEVILDQVCVCGFCVVDEHLPPIAKDGGNVGNLSSWWVSNKVNIHVFMDIG